MNTVSSDICIEAASTLLAEDIQHIFMSNEVIAALLMRREEKPVASVSDLPAVNLGETPEDDGENPAHRRSVSHDWPEIGTELKAHYYGFDYRATVVKADKRLKSGRQVRIDTGPEIGRICDSLSDAMLQATSAQRETENLKRKGVANGWDFWSWDGKKGGGI